MLQAQVRNLWRSGGKTEVNVDAPLTFTSLVNQSAVTSGFGATATLPLWGAFVAVNANFTWTKLQKVITPVPGRVISLRVGKNSHLAHVRSLTVWGGAMFQGILTETEGRITLSDFLSSMPSAIRVDR